MRRIGRFALAGTVAALLLGAEHAAAQGAPCSYEGSVYSDGSLSCQRGVQVQCMNGAWVNQEETCTEQYGGAGGELQMPSGSEQPAPTDAFVPSDSQVAPPDPDPGDY